jgi:hypothetical protein
MRTIDYSKITNDKELIRLLKKRDKIECEIIKIDPMVLVRYELEYLQTNTDEPR